MESHKRKRGISLPSSPSPCSPSPRLWLSRGSPPAPPDPRPKQWGPTHPQWGPPVALVQASRRAGRSPPRTGESEGRQLDKYGAGELMMQVTITNLTIILNFFVCLLLFFFVCLLITPPRLLDLKGSKFQGLMIVTLG